MSNLYRYTITAVNIALCVALPFALHAIPDAGSVLCPIHIPVFLCGLMCGWPYGLACGLIGPALSSLITGMPAMAALPQMLVECAIYGLVSGLLFQLVHTKHRALNLYISLIVAMILGRIGAGITLALVFARATTTFHVFFMSYFVVSLPGILIQLFLIPVVLAALSKAKLVPTLQASK
ncbi:MAG: ECF transporter S component [Oscillospiraceae bacterium]|jgi:LytS/YehU family sensor histidine kinase